MSVGAKILVRHFMGRSRQGGTWSEQDSVSVTLLVELNPNLVRAHHHAHDASDVKTTRGRSSAWLELQVQLSNHAQLLTTPSFMHMQRIYFFTIMEFEVFNI